MTLNFRSPVLYHLLGAAGITGVFTTTSGSNNAMGSVSQAGKMAQQIKVLDTKPDKLRLSSVLKFPCWREPTSTSSPAHVAWTHTHTQML